MGAWPLVLPDDSGIRPAGPPDACFYCDRKVGEEHARECVTVHKRIRVRYSFELELEVPHHWDAERFEFHRNHGTWCAANALDEIGRATEEHGCPCGIFRAELLSVVDDTPTVEPPRKGAP